MAKKKFYAVKIGRIPGIYNTWNECEKQVKGFPYAKYRGFSSLNEAENFLLDEEADSDNERQRNEKTLADKINLMADNKISSLKDDEVIAFVDGSYDVKEEKSAFGAILISSGGNKDILYKAFTKNTGEDFIALRNVAAELEGVKEAVNWSAAHKKKKLTVFYDYEGIEKWATGEWKAKKSLTRDYVSFIQEKKQSINIEFVKVLAHSGVKLNEEADRLAKNALAAVRLQTDKVNIEM